MTIRMTLDEIQAKLPWMDPTPPEGWVPVQPKAKLTAGVSICVSSTEATLMRDVDVAWTAAGDFAVWSGDIRNGFSGWLDPRPPATARDEFHWVGGGGITLAVDRPDSKQKLLVNIAPFGKSWYTVAIETGPIRLNTVEGGVDDVLDAHSHKKLGAPETPAEAIKLAEDFATEWLSRDPTAPSCMCTETPEVLRERLAQVEARCTALIGAAQKISALIKEQPNIDHPTWVAHRVKLVAAIAEFHAAAG